ncbi:MAG: polysulfide reductase NrfD [Thermoplasmata archaeon]|nr:polysulfide reductase NrfD [Thermoplasmata archaeon]
MPEVQNREMMCAPRLQQEWGFGGRRKIRDGALLIALFLGGIGAGQFVVSTWIFNYPLSALIGLLFVAVGKSAAHLIYLGRPTRFFRLFLKPRTSWISRGLIFMVILIIFGGGYLAPLYGFDWLPWTTEDLLGKLILAVALMAAFIVMIYDGFVLASCKSISSWHTMLLPVMFFAYAIAGGVAMTAITFIFDSDASLSVESIVSLDLVLLAAMGALVAFYIINLASSDITAKESLRRLLFSRTAFFFIGLSILAGLMIPLALTAMHQMESEGAIASLLLGISAVLELAGDISIRHSILKAGLHAPVF